jgi:hypothetical protein
MVLVRQLTFFFRINGHKNLLVLDLHQRTRGVPPRRLKIQMTSHDSNAVGDLNDSMLNQPLHRLLTSLQRGVTLPIIEKAQRLHDTTVRRMRNVGPRPVWVVRLPLAAADTGCPLVSFHNLRDEVRTYVACPANDNDTHNSNEASPQTDERLRTAKTPLPGVRRS